MISKRLSELKKEKFGDIPDDFSSEEQVCVFMYTYLYLSVWLYW